MFMRYLMPFLLGFAAKQLKKNSAAKKGTGAGGRTSRTSRAGAGTARRR